VKIFAHELSEALTDPELNAWINSGFIENGDLCVWTFGMTKLLPNGSSYNVIFGTRPYHIQRLWGSARGGYCALGLVAVLYRVACSFLKEPNRRDLNAIMIAGTGQKLFARWIVKRFRASIALG
jgi:hypothetical protein